MKSYLWGATVSTLFASMVAFAAPSLSPTALAVESGNSTGTKTRPVPTERLQEITPVQQYDLYLQGFHVARERPAVQGAAHYYCHQMTDEFIQCAIFGGNGRDARLIGVEYIISSHLFQSLTTDEQRLWHPHAYEVQSGLLIAPGLPQKVEHQLMEKLVNTYGKTWYLWQGKEQSLPVGYASNLPLGTASIMQGPTTDGQLRPALVEERDRRFNVAVNDLRQQRADITLTDALSQKEQRIARADTPVPNPEPQQPAPSTPPSDTPQAVDPEPEPHSNVPAPEGPPAIQQPLPAEPELPPPPTPQPAEPGLPPPPMPKPAEPPPLSKQPELNPPGPVEPEQRPSAPLPEPEPTLYKGASSE